MIIFDIKFKITSFTIFEDFTKSFHKIIEPRFSRSPFCTKFDSTGGIFSTLWDIAYQDVETLELFLDINVKTSFKFDTEETEKDLQDFLEVNEEFYRLILDHIKENCFGYFDKLPAIPSYPFNEGFDFLINRGYYK